MLDAALQLAEHYRLFPVAPGDKRPPLIKGWPVRATHDQAVIRQWWAWQPRANIAAATGAGLAVVDVDPRNGGTLEAVSELGLSLDTRSVRTPSGGWQLHYLVDAPVTSRVSALAPGVDVKAERGYVLLPPSRRNDGDYCWLLGPEMPILSADAEVLNRVNITYTADGRPIPATPRKRPEDVREGERHSQLTLWAGWFAANCDDLDQAIDLIYQYNERLSEPLDEAEVAGVVKWIERKTLQEAA